MTTRSKTKAKSSTSKKGRGSEPATRKIPIIGIVFGVVAVLLVVAIIFSSEDSIGTTGEFGEPVITGSALPAMETGASVVANDPGVGQLAPEVTGQDFDDSTVEIKHDGTPKAILFLAHWCPHCQAELPRVQAWLDSGGGVDGVDIISVTTSSNSGQNNWPPSEWLKREGWTSPNIRDDSDNSVLNAFGGSSFPYWVFLNGDGTLAYRQSGETDIATLQLIMQNLVSG